MKIESRWQDKMQFTAEADGHSVPMDAKPPIGSDSALTPKHMLLAGACGCTGMDVVALMKKYKQPLEALSVDAETEMTTGGFPVVFKEIRLTFRFKGGLEAAKVLEAVQLSQTKFCGVSAMLSKAVPIRYEVLNDESIGAGAAGFP